MSTQTETKTTDFMVTLATNLRTIRARAKVSQKELANRVGVSYPRISEIENGKGNPTIETLEKIAIALNVNISDLFNGKTSRKK